MTSDTTNGIEPILRSLSDSILIFEGFLRSIPADALGTRRMEDFWSIHEHADHLADVQPMLLERLQRMMTENMPEFIPFIPEHDDEPRAKTLRAVPEIIKQFASARKEQLALLTTAGPDDWKRMAVHPEYENYGLYILARHILMHDHWHMYRMEELWLTRDAYLTRLEG